jgi:hypothetical protein
VKKEMQSTNCKLRTGIRVNKKALLPLSQLTIITPQKKPLTQEIHLKILLQSKDFELAKSKQGC